MKIFVFLLLLLALSACGGGDQNSAGSQPTAPASLTAAAPEGGATATFALPETGQASPTGEVTPEDQATPAAQSSSTPEPTATPAVEPGVTFQNPVIKMDFPDPHVIQVEDKFYAYATNASGRNIQVAVSEDLVNWQLLRDAMPVLPSWAQLGGLYIWAPEVMQIGDKFLLYYTARDKQADKQCVGVAVADSPEGRFRDDRDAPLVCQAQQGGTIDAHPFRDGDKLYLFFKNDGNCCGRTTWIWSQEMAPDGLSLVGEPVQLVSNDRPWESTVIEAPTMVLYQDTYYLFYSANHYAGVEYAVGYAVCETPMGPCQDAPENPILKAYLQRPPVIGPGHQTLLQLGEDWWIIYHAWEVSPQGVKTDRRQVWIDRLVWEDGKPVVQGPTTGVQPVPEVQAVPEAP